MSNLKQHGNLRINADRLWSRHMEMAKIGAIPGDGNCRLAMSAEDVEARITALEQHLAKAAAIEGRNQQYRHLPVGLRLNRDHQGHRHHEQGLQQAGTKISGQPQ